MTKIEEARYEIPYGKFTKTSDGFTYTFKKSSPVYIFFTGLVILLAIMAAGVVSTVTKGPETKKQGQAALVMVAIIGVYFLAVRRPKTSISVTGETISIGKKTYSRKDFGSFFTRESGGQNKQNYHVWFTYGASDFPVPGPWDMEKSGKVAAALNMQTQATPRAGVATPTELRQVRPTGF